MRGRTSRSHGEVCPGSASRQRADPKKAEQAVDCPAAGSSDWRAATNLVLRAVECRMQAIESSCLIDTCRTGQFHAGGKSAMSSGTTPQTNGTARIGGAAAQTGRASSGPPGQPFDASGNTGSVIHDRESAIAVPVYESYIKQQVILFLAARSVFLSVIFTHYRWI